jgi:hypothetical protein
MNTHTETSALNSSSFGDDVIRGFLLGELNEQQRADLEACLLTSDELEARVRLQEISIVDQYVAGDLTRADAERFRERFAVTRDRNRLVTVSNALHERFSPSPASEVNVRLARVFNLRRPAWRYAFAAIILLIVFATVWLGIKEGRLAIRLPIPKRAQPKPSATQTPVIANHPRSSSLPTHSENVPPMPEHETVLPITLSKNNTVENPYELKLADGDAPLRAIIGLEQNQLTSYRAELWDSRGASMFSSDVLTPSDEGKLTVQIPGLNLPPGEYMIRLKGTEGTPELTYYLRIVR